MPIAARLFLILLPLFKVFSGAASFLLIYTMMSTIITPLFDSLMSRLNSEVAGVSSCTQFCQAVAFFDIDRAITVVVSAMVCGLAIKATMMAARAASARVAS